MIKMPKNASCRVFVLLQIFTWGNTCAKLPASGRLPHILEPKVESLEMLECLLDRCCNNLDPQSDWPPPQDVECLAVATLNLLRLQVSSSRFHSLFLLNKFPRYFSEIYSFSGYWITVLRGMPLPVWALARSFSSDSKTTSSLWLAVIRH